VRQRIVVTGVAGFIGSHLVEALLDAGYRVTGIDNFSDYYPRERKMANLETAFDCLSFRLIEADILDAEGTAIDPQVVEALSEADALFHLAARPGVHASWGDGFTAYLRDNVLATHALMKAARSAGIGRVVYASSSSVYGDGCPLPMEPEATCAPSSPYGFTKLAGERLVREHMAEEDVVVAILRLFTVYGPRQRPDMAFQRAIEAVNADREFEVYGDGSQTRDFTYVDDVVEAFLGALTLTSSCTCNVGGGTQISLAEALDVVRSVAGAPVRIRHTAARPGDVRGTQASVERTNEVLGWAARVPLDAGLARQVAWWERHRDRFAAHD